MHASDALKLINYCYYVKVILKHCADKLLMETGMKRKPGSTAPSVQLISLVVLELND